MSLTGENGEPPSGPTVNPAGQDSGEQAAQALERAERTLAEVSAALNRLDDQSFGRCEICGSAIDEKTLMAHPTTMRCARCGSAQATEAAPD